jgi:hypothetical protein
MAMRVPRSTIPVPRYPVTPMAFLTARGMRLR